MRTKLDAAEQGGASAVSRTIEAAELAELSLRLAIQPDRLSVVSGGTAARTLMARGDEGARFLKTYDGPRGALRLRQEAALLTAAYPDMIGAAIVEVPVRGRSHPWLVMDELFIPAAVVEPEAVHQIITAYSLRVNAAPVSAIAPRETSVAHLLATARPAVDELERRGELDRGAARDMEAALDLIEARLTLLPPILCHGDLSPRNIMADRGGHLFAIDWEDALWGVEGYDYLYWLTFFQNRRFYGSSRVLGVTTLGRDLEVALMLFIVLIKGYIAAVNGTSATNSLSLTQRIAEISAI